VILVNRSITSEFYIASTLLTVFLEKTEKHQENEVNDEDFN